MYLEGPAEAVPLQWQPEWHRRHLARIRVVVCVSLAPFVAQRVLSQPTDGFLDMGWWHMALPWILWG